MFEILLYHNLENQNFIDGEISHFLKKKRCKIEYCNEISTAIKNYKETQHQIIIVNIEDVNSNTFELIKEINRDISTIIILSPSDKFALKCFNEGISYYLLTPLIPAKLEEAIRNCIKIIESFRKQNLIVTSRKNRFLTIKSANKTEIIKTMDIIYLEADGRYTTIYLDYGGNKVISKNLGEFEKILDSDIFCRVHHKYIVNINKLINISKSKLDGNFCEMSGNVYIPISKRKFENLNKILMI